MSKKANKIIITCAVTCGIHTPTMSDALPYTPDDIASQAIAAAEAGAPIISLHAGPPPNGRAPSPPHGFLQCFPRTKKAPAAGVHHTSRDGSKMSPAQRVAAAL